MTKSTALPLRLTLLVILTSLSLVACEQDEAPQEPPPEEESTEQAELTDEELAEVEEVEEVEKTAEKPEADSSFMYIPFRSDQEPVIQSGHAMAFVETGDDGIEGFRVLIAPTHIEFICGNPNMNQRGQYADGEKSLTMIAADGFALEPGDYPIEFFNVGSTGVDIQQDLRFAISEITDDAILGSISLHGESDDEQRINAEFRATRCDM